MLPDTLSIIKENTKMQNLVTTDQLEKYTKLLSGYKSGDLLYPGVVMRCLRVSREVAYTLLEVVRNMGLLKLNYELYCHYCNEFEDGIYETLSSIPEGICCEKCDEELSISRNCIVIYRVISEAL